MNICIPVTQDNGLESRVNAQFASAPFFVLVDTGSGTCRTVPNTDDSHALGRNQPMAALAGETIDAALVISVGPGALAKLYAAGIRVHMARAGSAGEALEAFTSGTLAEIKPAGAGGNKGQGLQGSAAQGHGQQGQSRFGQGARGPGAGSPRRGGRSGER